MWKGIPVALNASTKSNNTNVLLTSQGNLLHEKKAVVVSFNNHFTGIILNIDYHLPDPTSNYHAIFLPSFQTSLCFLEVGSAIRYLKHTSSSEYDNITVTLVKQISLTLFSPLSRSINKFFLTGFYPDALKIIKIILVFKKGNKTKDKYRPVAIVPAFANMIEELLLRDLQSYCAKTLSFLLTNMALVQAKSAELAVLIGVKH